MYNNTCCLDIISFALFKKKSSPGRKYPRKFGPPFHLEMLAFGYTIVSLVYQHYFHKAELENVQIWCCLDEWKEGTRQDIHLDSHTYDCIYDRILADIQAADQIPYYHKRLLEMQTAWWNRAMYVPSLNYNSGFLMGSKVLFSRSPPTPTPTPLSALVVTEIFFLWPQDSHWAHHQQLPPQQQLQLLLRSPYRH